MPTEQVKADEKRHFLRESSRPRPVLERSVHWPQDQPVDLSTEAVTFVAEQDGIGGHIDTGTPP